MAGGLLSGILQFITAGGTLLDSDKGGVVDRVLAAYGSKEGLMLSFDGSVGRLLNDYVVEPTIMITPNAEKSGVAPKVLNLCSDMYVAYYMQAYEILTEILGVDMSTAIKVLGTDNGSVSDAVMGSIGIINNESFNRMERALSQSPNNPFGSFGTSGGVSLGFEAKGGGDRAFLPEEQQLNASRVIIRQIKLIARRKNSFITDIKREAINDDVKKRVVVKTRDAETGGSQDDTIEWTASRRITPIDDVNPDNFDNIGKSGNVTSVTHKEQIDEINLTITVRMNIIVADIDDIISLQDPHKEDNDLSERIDDMKSGAISFWTDLILCNDLIDAYKKNKVRDLNKLHQIINSRKISANSKYVTNKMAGFEKFYNMIVVTGDEKDIIDQTVKGNAFNEPVKDNFLTGTGSLSLTVIDEDHDRVSMVTKDMKGMTYMRFSELENRKDKTNSYDEIIKAMQMNTAPRF
jgi:hypothetical protein